jgi:sugar lactone lactonase YvrE
MRGSTPAALLAAAIAGWPWLAPTTARPTPPLPELSPATAHVATVAGNGQRGRTNGHGELAEFNWPTGVAIGPDWSLYIADYANHLIRKISPDGLVTTLAGSGQPGSVDGRGERAQFKGPDSIVLAPSGDLYVADADNRQIRKVAPGGAVTTVAGSGRAGSRDGPARAAEFGYPTGVAVDSGGTLYVADRGAHKIRKITPEGQVSTLAGSGLPGYTDGMGQAAQFHDPMTLVVDPTGRLFVADSGTHTIRVISPTGRVTTLAGAPRPGFVDGVKEAARFNWPTGLAQDGAGNLYVADSNHAAIRKITPDGVVTTLAGGSPPGNDDGPGQTARFSFPTGVAVDRQGSLYIADSANNMIRRISAGPRFFTATPLPRLAFGLRGQGRAYYTGDSPAPHPLPLQ